MTFKGQNKGQDEAALKALPNGVSYPMDCTDEQLMDTLRKLSAIAVDAGGWMPDVEHAAVFIRLGSNELQRRAAASSNQIATRLTIVAMLLTLASIGLAAWSLYFASETAKTDKNWLAAEIHALEQIHGDAERRVAVDSSWQREGTQLLRDIRTNTTPRPNTRKMSK